MADWLGVDVSDATCSIEGCEKKRRKRGWCDMHYWRWRRTGTTDERSAPRPDPESRIDKDAPGGCWLWTGTRTAKGYGRLVVEGRLYRAHRYFYELLVGPIPDGLELDHLCRVTACVNPAHLEPVTRRENLARSTNPAGVAIRYNTCIRGHALTEDNVYRIPSRPRSRRCKICHAAQRSKRSQAA